MRRIILLMLVTAVSMAEYSNTTRKSEKEQRWIFTIESENASKIIERIFKKSYNKDIRPFIGVKPLVIDVIMAVTSISEISEENMEFKCTMYMRQTWHDPRLAFGEDNTTIVLAGENLDKIWLPDTYIDNARKTTVDKQTSAAILFANGTVHYSHRSSSTVGANMNFLNYPMDEQKLNIHLISYMHDEDKIVLKWQSGDILNNNLATYVLHKITLLERKELFVTGIYSSLVFQFEIRRRLGYFLMQFYFPCVLSVLVSWLPFWMDRYEIGDRVALGITTLLTEVFLSQYINSAMPRVSYIKAADEFLLVSFVFIMIALIESVVVYNVRQDVRERRKGHQLSPPQKTQSDRRNESTKEIENPAFDGDIPFSIRKVLHANFKPKHDEAKAKTHGRKDLDLRVDQISRVAFPVIYVLFVSYYFGRYASY